MTWIDRRLLSARRGRWQWYWGVLGLVAVGGGTIAIAMALSRLAALWPDLNQILSDMSAEEDLMFAPGRWDAYAAFVFFSLPPILATAATIGWVHRWPVRHVLGPGGRFAWSHFAKSATALLLLYAGASVIGYLVEPAHYTLQAVSWTIVPWILLAGVVILPQAFSEDFLFNGYLSRVWGGIVPFRLMVPIALSVVFSAAHAFNADLAKDPIPAHVALFGGQFIALLIYVRTGSLGATVGLHWMNNMFLVGFVATAPGYRNEIALFVYRDPVLSAGGSYLYDPVSWGLLAAGLWLTWFVLSWRNSPFYIPDRTDVPPSLEGEGGARDPGLDQQPHDEKFTGAKM